MKNQTQKPKSHKLLSLFLYFLPIFFFLISYFLMTTSGEDIHQGAGSLSNGIEINAIKDASNALSHSGRITDMYAWTVIDLFDYQFQFGIDTIFRLFDAILISGSLFIATYIILGRKPKLQIKDSLVFCSVFVAIVFTLFGRRLYSEFSMIHNYVPLVFITLLFSIPYVKLLQNQSISNKHHLLDILWLPLGFIFGMSTTITPLAFLATAIIYIIIKRQKLSKLPVWFYTGLIGLAIGSCLSFFLSSGMNNYALDPSSVATFDYISITNFLDNPIQTLPRLLFHALYNFAMVLLPLALVALFATIFSKSFHQIFIKHPIKPLSPNTKRLLLAFTLFIFIHVFASIQIKSPPRILLPAYLAGVILILRIFTPHIKSFFLGGVIVVLTLSAIIIHTVFLNIYHHNTAIILEEIKSSPESSLCIEKSRNLAPRLPIINLSQEYMIVDWGYPEPIYGKNITFCQPNS